MLLSKSCEKKLVMKSKSTVKVGEKKKSLLACLEWRLLGNGTLDHTRGREGHGVVGGFKGPRVALLSDNLLHEATDP